MKVRIPKEIESLTEVQFVFSEGTTKEHLELLIELLDMEIL